eukprot:scaffold2671_cov252-Pinguiococcus_pyrenoidosus.AAC.28
MRNDSGKRRHAVQILRGAHAGATPRLFVPLDVREHQLLQDGLVVSSVPHAATIGRAFSGAVGRAARSTCVRSPLRTLALLALDSIPQRSLVVNCRATGLPTPLPPRQPRRILPERRCSRNILLIFNGLGRFHDNYCFRGTHSCVRVQRIRQRPALLLARHGARLVVVTLQARSVVFRCQREEILQLVRAEEPLLPRILQYPIRYRRLEDLSMVDLLLDGPRGDQTVDGHGLGLPDAPASLASLRIHLRIPVRIVQQDAIRPRQIHTDPPRPCRANHGKGLLHRSVPIPLLVAQLCLRVEAIYQSLPGADLGFPIDSNVLQAQLHEEMLDDVEHLAGLREDHAAMALPLPQRKDSHEHQELPRARRIPKPHLPSQAADDGLFVCIVRLERRLDNVSPVLHDALGGADEIGVIAQLPKHGDRAEALPGAIKDVADFIGGQEVFVQLPLPLGQAAEENLLRLLGENEPILRDALVFRPSQQVRPDQLPEDDRTSVGNQSLLSTRVRVSPSPNRLAELQLEGWQRSQPTGEDEVQQGPKLPQVVLNRGAGQQDPVWRAKLLRAPGNVRVGIADLLALVQHHVAPGQRHQYADEAAQGLVRTNADTAPSWLSGHVKLRRIVLSFHFRGITPLGPSEGPFQMPADVLLDSTSTLASGIGIHRRRLVQDHDPHLRCPHPELTAPVRDHCRRADDQGAAKAARFIRRHLGSATDGIGRHKISLRFELRRIPSLPSELRLVSNETAVTELGDATEIRDYLCGLAQPHLVPHDAPGALQVQPPQPAQAFNLVRVEALDQVPRDDASI